ncbi:hypothetical protein ACFP3T_03145 [Lactiplantibacillus dongliensis]|uniref:SpoVT-AbrB domain-containing protein n=1 Tax=Lactiplantibacillus dongliensis TaxID=2559919 RepID=A0ABW1R4E6_9LACO|nr:hypothetical protein [Lactiplantibacillus dongliensis]
MANTVEITTVDGCLGIKLPTTLVTQYGLQAGQSLQVDFDATNTLTLQDHDVSPEFMRAVQAAVDQYSDALELLRLKGD